MAPNRIDLLREAGAVDFGEVRPRRIESAYGRAHARWIALDGLIAIEAQIDDPRHQEDVRVLRRVRELKGG